MPAALGAVLFSVFGTAGVTAGATLIAGTTLASIVGGHPLDLSATRKALGDDR